MPVNMDKLVSLDRAKEIKTTENGMIATVEASSTASKAYAVGDYFYYTGKLYKATAAIASGGTITPGTNCTLAKLADDVGDLKSALDSCVDVLSDKVNALIASTANGYIKSSDASYSSNTAYKTYTYKIDENCAFVTAKGSNGTNQTPRNIAFISFLDANNVRTVAYAIPSTDSTLHTETVQIPKTAVKVSVCVTAYYVTNTGLPEVSFTKLADIDGIEDAISGAYGGELTQTRNGYVSTSGEYSSNSAYKTYTYTVAENYTKMTAKGSNATSQTAQNIAFITFVDGDDAPVVAFTITSSDSTTHTETVDIPRGSVKAWVCVTADYVAQNGDPQVSFNGVVDVGEKVRLFDSEIQNTVIDKIIVVYGGYTVTTSSLSDSDSTKRARTPICDVSKYGNEISVSMPSTIAINSLNVFDGTSWSSVSTGTNTYFEFENTVKLFRLSFANKANNNTAITQEELNGISVIPTNQVPIGNIVDDLTWFYGKTYAAMGDSITYGFIPRNYEGYPGKLKSYAQLVAEKLGMSFRNYGISGSSLAYIASRDPMCRRYTNLPDAADVITFMGGANDIRNGIELGTMDDRDDSTYYGALHVLMGGLYKKYMIDQGTEVGKGKKIIALTPIKLLDSSAAEQGGTGTLVDFDAWIDAVKEVAAYYSIPCLDFYNLSGINPHLNETIQGTETGYTGYYNPYITDGTHPTQEGQQIMADVFCGFLKTLV